MILLRIIRHIAHYRFTPNVRTIDVLRTINLTKVRTRKVCANWVTKMVVTPEVIMLAKPIQCVIFTIEIVTIEFLRKVSDIIHVKTTEFKLKLGSALLFVDPM